MSRSQRRRNRKAKQITPKNNGSRQRQKARSGSADRALEVFICIGHIVAAVTLVVEHLL